MKILGKILAYPGCINHNFLWNVNYADLNCVIEKGQQDLLTLNSALSFKFRRTSLVALMWQCQKMTIQSPFFIKRILTDRPVYFGPSFFDMVSIWSEVVVPNWDLIIWPTHPTLPSQNGSILQRKRIFNTSIRLSQLNYHKVSDNLLPVRLNWTCLQP